MCINKMIQKPVNVSWNAFEYKTSRTFKDLRCNENFTDVTLATEDNQQIDAHRVILSTSSPFFKTILERNPHQKPLLYLKDILYLELRNVLDYIYIGECQVNSDRLDKFLRVGEVLQIDGLTEQTLATEQQNSSHEPLHESLNASIFENLPKSLFQQEPLDDFIEVEEQLPKIVKTNLKKNESITSEIVSRIGKHSQLLCNVCNFVSANEYKMTKHIKIHSTGEDVFDENKREQECKVEEHLDGEIVLQKTVKNERKTLKLQSKNWNIKDRHIDLKDLDNQIMTDRLLMKKLKCYVSEKQRPILSFLRRRGEVIMCGDKMLMERIKEAPALEKALKDIFFNNIEEKVNVQEFNEDIVLPPLNFPFRDSSQGWSANVAMKQALLYLHIIDFSGYADKQERQNRALNTPVWWPENVTFRVPFIPSYATKEENENIIVSIFNFYGLDINNYHL